MKAGVTINRPPRDGVMAFVRSPDRQSVELLQTGAALPPRSREVDAEHRQVVISGRLGHLHHLAAGSRVAGGPTRASPGDDGLVPSDYRSQVEICE